MTRDPQEIRADLEATRERMAETLEALGEKADVKSRAKERMSGGVAAVKERLRPALAKVAGDGEADGEDGRRRGPILWVAGLAAGFVLGILMPGGRQA